MKKEQLKEAIKKEIRKVLIENENDKFSRFTMKVNKEGEFPYKGTIKRSQKGWELYDEKGDIEETEPFDNLLSLLSYYDITKDNLTGEYVKNLR